ncbi:MAG: winged helix-turn-helix transcriptional regulator [Candidatus Micrarchaeia archaeon]
MELYNYRERAIMRALSEDASASLSSLSKTAKCSRATVTRILKRLTKEFGIKFTIELNDDALGFTQRHLIAIKFGKEPSRSEIADAFKDDIYSSNIYLCKGDFDLLVQVRSNNSMDYIVWESLLPGKLGDFKPKIYPSELMLTNFGYFPISPEQITAMARNLNAKDIGMLSLLAQNSRIKMTALAKKLGINRTTANYRLFSLRKANIIKKFTISINKPPKNYIIAYLVNYTFNKTSHIRSVRMMEYYKNYDEELPIMNSFSLLAPMSGSYRFFGMGAFEDRKTAINSAIKAHMRIFDKEEVSIKHAQVVAAIKGSYPFRNVDIKKEYTRFQWNTEGNSINMTNFNK